MIQGYDSILQNLEAALVERLENTKQDETKHKSEDEEVVVQNERELIQNDSVVEIEESAVSESEPVEEDYGNVGPVQIEDETKVAVDEANGGLRGAIETDEPEGSESVNDDVILFEHESHDDEGQSTTVIHMEHEGDALETNEPNNDRTAFEL